jgi:hypothetical protein
VSFIEKIKTQAASTAASATAAAKDAAAKGQAKLDEYQAKRAADGMLRDLGAAYYAEETGRGTTKTASDRERLIGALKLLEDESGPIDLGEEHEVWTAPARGVAVAPSDEAPTA